METRDSASSGNNYWRLLDQAFTLLDGGDFSASERAYHQAVRLRESSPGRVFLTEKIGDRLRRMLRNRGRQDNPGSEGGLWERRNREFRESFLARADIVVREGLRVAGLRPEDEAEANQPVLERALYLVTGSALFPAEPRSAVPLLKGLVRTACRTGRTFSHRLLRHDLPLTEEDRLWLASRGGDMLEAFVDHERLAAGSPQAEEWARAVLQLLKPEYFGSSSRLAMERAWLEATAADRLLGRPATSVALYRAFLDQGGDGGERTRQARLRLLEILANVDGADLTVPRYREALDQARELQDLEGAERRRHARALQCIQHRQPALFRTGEENLAWVSVGMEQDGALGVVFWWDDQPRDAARWRPGQDPSFLQELLTVAPDRIVGWSCELVASTGEHWEHGCGPVSAQGLAAAVLESRLPASGLDPVGLLELALTEAGPWRDGWSSPQGHPDLEPPSGKPAWSAWVERPFGQGLLAGLLLLAVRSHLERSDPSLRAGLRELGRRGDAAADFLYELATLGKPACLALDENFAPWTLPLLWTRPGPWRADEDHGREPGSLDMHPDLSRHDLVIVATGEPAAVMRGWGGENPRWRVVWDRPLRRSLLGAMAGDVLGPVTLVPATGEVHDLRAALDLLDDLLDEARRGDPETTGLLPVFHWVRLVETHNGDLGDFLEIRDRRTSGVGIYETYSRRISDLPRLPVEADDTHGWAAQYRQRSRKSGLVAGSWRLLDREAPALDARWGVFDGSDGSWVFVDSAAVHDRLLDGGEGEVMGLHGLLVSRGHRHLSLLLGAVWLPQAISRYLRHLLMPYGRAFVLTLQDRRVPALLLAERGLRPDGRRVMDRALASQWRWLAGQEEASDLALLLPDDPALADFWRAGVGGAFGRGAPGVDLLDGREAPEEVAASRLVIPMLPRLPGVPNPAPVREGESWLHLDERRHGRMATDLARCAVSLAGWLAGPWREVVVLDVRWWHLLWGGGPLGDGEVTADSWSFAAASRLAGAPDARPLQLPAATDGGRDDQRLTEAVRNWLREKDLMPAAVPMAGASASERESGVVLAGKDAARAIALDAERVATAREQGQLDAWLLVVAERPDPAWRDIVEQDAAPGSSVAGPDGLTHPPAALVVLHPDQLLDPRLASMLKTMPPAAIHVPESGGWLPDRHRERPARALALRALLETGRRLTLHAPSWPRPWVDFLIRRPGCRLDEAAEVTEDTGASAPPTVPCQDLPGPRGELLRSFLGRLREVLGDQRDATEGGDRLVSARELVSPRMISRLAGIAPDEAAQGIRALRWALSVDGMPLPAAEKPQTGRSHDTHAALVGGRFAELEHRLRRAARCLEVVLPLWLQGLGPGMLRWVRLDEPPAEVDAGDLAFVDAFLELPGLDDDPGADGDLLYAACDGALHSSRRLIGFRGDAAAAVTAQSRRLDRMRRRLGEMLDAAVETGSGFLVDTGRTGLDDGERDFLALGAALGLWRWLGPADKGALSLVDLLAVADVAGDPAAEPAWRLCGHLLDGRPGPSGAGPAASPSVDDDVPVLRRLLSRQGRRRQLEKQAVAVVRDTLAQEGPGLMALCGPAGSGRHAALAMALAGGTGSVASLRDVRIYCPDHAAAAAVSRELMLHAPGVDCAVEVPPAGAVFPVPESGGPSPDRPVVALCEIQRFDADLRYRLSQAGRVGHLLLTVDPWATSESWESLFLTTPGPSQMHDCALEQRTSGRIWSQLRRMRFGAKELPPATAGERAGMVTAAPAANLDQCLGRLFAAGDFTAEDTVLRVIADVGSDLDYIGGVLSTRGWAVSAEDDLEPWLTPGPRTFLAAVLAAVSGGADPLAARLLTATVDADWERWCGELGEKLRSRDMSACCGVLESEPVLQPVLAHDAHRRTLRAVLEPHGKQDPEDFLTAPVILAARRILHGDLELGPPGQGCPVALLNRADHTPGLWARAAMDLCRGSEHPGRHYQQWSRVGESLLVLYTERSPLAGD